LGKNLVNRIRHILIGYEDVLRVDFVQDETRIIFPGKYTGIQRDELGSQFDRCKEGKSPFNLIQHKGSNSGTTLDSGCSHARCQFHTAFLQLSKGPSNSPNAEEALMLRDHGIAMRVLSCKFI
jgi:hypothetical protein